ncbi:unnamed protein product [Rotaria sordida]|uniref:Uncharacterized protein n=1 Tax=Rotaria sordida TaxID=392033 RepID=A0A815TYD1_9BILA|nr:unnamed protein product [Rotaria sordida]CAF1508444.1 unnamed protein product [Rotaria sordida]
MTTFTYGGFITTEKNETTYILILNTNVFTSTYLFYTRQDQQFVIHVQVCNADGSMCTVNLTNNQTTTLLSSSLLLLLPSTYDDSPLLDLLFNTTIKQKYEDKHSHVHEQINTTLNSEMF